MADEEAKSLVFGIRRSAALWLSSAHATFLSLVLICKTVLREPMAGKPCIWPPCASTTILITRSPEGPCGEYGHQNGHENPSVLGLCKPWTGALPPTLLGMGCHHQLLPQAVGVVVPSATP